MFCFPIQGVLNKPTVKKHSSQRLMFSVLSTKPLSVFCLLGILLSFFLAPLFADITTNDGNDGRQNEKKAPERETLRLMPLKGTVRAGEWVDVPVEVFGAGLGRVNFELMQAPAQGQLSAPEPKIVENDPRPQYVLRFDARQIKQAQQVTFRFRATALGANPSPAVNAVIQVLPPKVRLFAPKSLDLGTVFYGKTASKMLNLENGSAQDLSLTATLSGKGWRWKDQPIKLKREVTITAKGMVDLPIEFEAKKDAQERGTATLTTSSGDIKVTLLAQGKEMLLMNETALKARNAQESKEQKPDALLQDLVLSNESKQALVVKLTGSAQLNLPQSVTVPAEQSLRLSIEPKLNQIRKGVKGVLTLSYAGRSKELAWEIPAQAAKAILLDEQGQAVEALPAFEDLILGEQAQRKLRLRNVGGKADFIHVSTEPPFELVGLKEVNQLNPDEELAFTLKLNPSLIGSLESELRFGFGLTRNKIPLSAQILPNPANELEEPINNAVRDEPKGADPESVIKPEASLNSDAYEEDFSAATSQDLANRRQPKPQQFIIKPQYDEEFDHDTVALSWALPKRSDATKLQWDFSWLSAAVKEKGAWQTIPTRVKIDEEAQTASVLIDGIKRKNAVFWLRITAKDPSGQEVLADRSFQIRMQSRPSFWKRFQLYFWILLGLGVCGGGAFWWFKLR